MRRHSEATTALSSAREARLPGDVSCVRKRVAAVLCHRTPKTDGGSLVLIDDQVIILPIYRLLRRFEYELVKLHIQPAAEFETHLTNRAR